MAMGSVKWVIPILPGVYNNFSNSLILSLNLAASSSDLSFISNGTLTTALGQVGDRYIAYQLCSTKGCTDILTTDKTTIAAKPHSYGADYEEAPKALAVVTPVLTASVKPNNSTSKWVFMIALAIITLVAIEVLVASSLKKRKPKNGR